MSIFSVGWRFLKDNYIDIATAGGAVAACLLLAYALASPSRPLPPPSIGIPDEKWAAAGNCTPFFSQSALSSFSYDVVADGSRRIRMAQEFAGFDPASGLIVLQGSIEEGEGALTIIRFLDGQSMECRKQLLSLGGEAIQAFDCSGGSVFFGNACGGRLEEAGREEVKVPAGSFNATIYRDNASNASYWVVVGVPVPVKFAVGGMSGKLESYVVFNRTW